MRQVIILSFFISMLTFSNQTFAKDRTLYDHLRKPTIDKVEVIYYENATLLYIYGKGFRKLKRVELGDVELTNFQSQDDALIVVQVPKEITAGTYNLTVQTKRSIFSPKKKIQITLGVTGPEGEVGEQGPVGPEGEQGAVGPIGSIGPRGPRGINGTNGRDGVDGERGLQGEQGLKGEKGELGISAELLESILKRLEALEQK